MINQSFKIREPLPDDVEYILKTWTREISRTMPRHADGHSTFPQRLFYDEYQAKVIAPLMRKARARVIVPVTDVSFIAGFLVGNVYPETKTTVAHFVYTRPPFRRLGLMMGALQDMGHEDGFEIVATHWSKYLNRFQRPELIYNYLALYGVPE